MNDIYIYKQKAEKYKYKYLKLKQELYGGAKCTFDLPINYKGKEKKILFDKSNQSNKINIYIEYPKIDNTFDNFNEYNIEENNGQILKYKDYLQILDNFKDKLETINKIYLDNTHVQNIELACKIYYKYKKSMIRNQTNYFNVIFSECESYKIYDNNEKEYGYIIRKKKEEINTLEKYIEFINNLRNAIEKFIKPLHNAGYVLNNIDASDIIWYGEKVYFNIERMKINDDKNIDIKGLLDYILNYFKFDLNNNYYYTNKVLKKFSNISINIDDLLNYILNPIEELINYDKEINSFNNENEKIMNKIHREYELSASTVKYEDIYEQYLGNSEYMYSQHVNNYIQENKDKYLTQIKEIEIINNKRQLLENDLLTFLKKNKYFSNLNNLKDLNKFVIY
jgi:hypothetical protein